MLYWIILYMLLNVSEINNFTLFSHPLLSHENFKDCVFLKNRNSQLTLSKFRFSGNKCKLHAALEISLSLHNFQLKWIIAIETSISLYAPKYL